MSLLSNVLTQVTALRLQADKLNAMAEMHAIVLEKERLRHAQAFSEQQASYTRIGKLHSPVGDDVDFVSQLGTSVVNHEAKRAISNTMTWMDQIDAEVRFPIILLVSLPSPTSGDAKTESHC